MTESKPEVSNSKIFDVDTLARQFAFLAVLLYIIGFLTTNLYLQQFGFSDFSPINPRFILTGGLVLFPIIFNYLLLTFEFSILSDKFSNTVLKSKFTVHQLPALILKTTKKIFVSPILLLSIPILIFPYIIYFLCFIKNDTVFNGGLKAVYLCSFILVLSLLPSILWREHIIFSIPLTKLSLDKQDYRTVFMILLFSLYLYIIIFAQDIYPQVPEQFGGGEPRKVRILFAKAQAEALQKNGISTCSSGNVLSNWSKPVSLLFEGSEKYLLRLEDKRPPIQLYKRNVDVVEPILETYNQKQRLIECPYTYSDRNIQKK